MEKVYIGSAMCQPAVEASALFLSVAVIASRVFAFLNTCACAACPSKVAENLNKFQITVLKVGEKVKGSGCKCNERFYIVP